MTEITVDKVQVQTTRANSRRSPYGRTNGQGPRRGSRFSRSGAFMKVTADIFDVRRCLRDSLSSRSVSTTDPIDHHLRALLQFIFLAARGRLSLMPTGTKLPCHQVVDLRGPEITVVWCSQVHRPAGFRTGNIPAFFCDLATI
ncbi:hypothetical protein Bbelb_419560 [Branchiostoma belcheri]|nr:hypothetical protein Bbelb_419560 [Branchiostoma belcheri]